MADVIHYCPECGADLDIPGSHGFNCSARTNFDLTSTDFGGTLVASEAASEIVVDESDHASVTTTPVIPPPPSYLQEPALTANALTVLERRYLQRNDQGEIIETPKDMFWRVACTVASAERDDPDRSYWALQFYEAMTSCTFMPNSPVLMNAGTGKGTMSACFVIPINDTMESILDGAKAAGMVQKFGGGTGFSFSRLRKRGDYIRSTQGNACGPVSVLLHYNDVARLVTQGGKREGANMGVLRYNHPDIMEFVKLKQNVSRCVSCHQPLAYLDNDLIHAEDGPWTHDAIEDTTAANFNISVAVDHAFFTAIRTNKRIPLWNVRNSIGPFKHMPEIENSGYIDAVELFNEITAQAWRNGDPGLLFMQRINEWRSNPVPSLGPIDATNPCGEKPLYDWDSCILGHLNLTKFVLPNGTSWQQRFNWYAFQRYISLAVRFLDNVIDVNDLPFEQITETSKAIRRIGAGVMGFADMLYMLEVPYNSNEARDIADEIASFFEQAAWSASRQLAEERGAFPLFADSIYNGQDHPNVPVDFQGVEIRNSVRTTIAPTGTTAIIAGCSSGIEPNFQLQFVRQHKIGKDEKTGENQWVKMTELNPVLEQWMQLHQDFHEGDPLPDYPDYFVTANDINYVDHIKMQAVWQQHIDDGVSKTINFPNNATVEDFRNAYLLADALGCLGITCYRDGSRSYQVLGVKETAAKESIEARIVEPMIVADDPDPDPTKAKTDVLSETIKNWWTSTFAPLTLTKDHDTRPVLRKRLPDDRLSRTHKFSVGGQEGYLTVGFYPDGCPGEIFIKIAKQGSTVQGFADAMGVLVSMLLQYGALPQDIARKLTNTTFEPSGLTTNRTIPRATSIADYVGQYLMVHYGDGQRGPIMTNPSSLDTEVKPTIHDDALDVGRPYLPRVSQGDTCPECGHLVYHESGCMTCNNCGWSQC